MSLAHSLLVRRIRAHSDSRLVVGQVNGEFEARDPKMEQYVGKVHNMMQTFDEFALVYIPREENTHADALSKLASSDCPSSARTVYTEVLRYPSVPNEACNMAIESVPEWTDDLKVFLTTSTLPDDPNLARAIKRRSCNYRVIQNALYLALPGHPYLLCADATRSEKALDEVHGQICSTGEPAWMMSQRIRRRGLYFPKMLERSQSTINKCPGCKQALGAVDGHEVTNQVVLVYRCSQAFSSGDWRSPYIDYLKDGKLPEDKKQARSVKNSAGRYELTEGILYRKGFSTPYLRCLSSEEAEKILKEAHTGLCGGHTGGRSLASTVLRAGYFWPTLLRDSSNLARRCQECQKHGPVHRKPPTPISIIQSPLPFAVWGLDLLGPFPTAPGQRKFLIVAVDYFTKWIEAEPLATITEAKCRDFFWKSIVCRFGVPRVLITDNGRQFDNDSFRGFCDQLGIELRYTSVAHPQTNGQAENANKQILNTLKKRLDGVSKSWVDELPSTLWSLRTTKRTPTGETPFNLTYGTEATIPLEVSLGVPSYRVGVFDENTNGLGLRSNLDLLEEVRSHARIRMETYKRLVAKHFNARVKPRGFELGDLVLRKVEASDPRNQGKLKPNWEGPYKITRIVRPGSYHLKTLQGAELQRAWNADNLKKYYP